MKRTYKVGDRRYTTDFSDLMKIYGESVYHQELESLVNILHTLADDRRNPYMLGRASFNLLERKPAEAEAIKDYAYRVECVCGVLPQPEELVRILNDLGSKVYEVEVFESREDYLVRNGLFHNKRIEFVAGIYGRNSRTLDMMIASAYCFVNLESLIYESYGAEVFSDLEDKLSLYDFNINNGNEEC